MYCNKCNAFNPDSSNFCCNCGADLSAQRNTGNFSGGAQPGGGQNFHPRFKTYTNVLPIISLIISIVAGNLISIILSAVALSRYNNYERAYMAHDYAAADAFGSSSRNLSIASIVLSAVLFVIGIIASVALLLFGFDFGISAFSHLI